jgi:hypothetical protein
VISAETTIIEDAPEDTIPPWGMSPTHPWLARALQFRLAPPVFSTVTYWAVGLGPPTGALKLMMAGVTVNDVVTGIEECPPPSSWHPAARMQSRIASRKKKRSLSIRISSYRAYLLSTGQYLDFKRAKSCLAQSKTLLSAGLFLAK